MKQQFLSWWYGLASREQRLLLWAGVVVVLGMFYWLVWQPLHQSRANNELALQQAQRQLMQLQQLIPQIQQANAGSARVGGSLAQIVSNSARSHGIRVSRMQPQNEQLQLVLDDVAFEQLLSWLYQLQYQNAVKLINLDLSNTDKSGIVRVRRMVIE
ncbi:type II secretion system protein M [Arsukibacterium sp.]|uniref:type II secretion system protein M n=1 Tax=Arsukibacterium sp. TaxID=1977258 RepID=UPI002FD9788E